MKLPKKWTEYSDSVAYGVAYGVAYRIDPERSSGNPGRNEIIGIPDLPLEFSHY
jgi:hypothetical protein